MDRRLMLARAEAALAACNRGDAEGFVAHMADDVIWRDVALAMPLLGRAALVDSVQTFMNAFPDLRIEATSWTIDGPRLAQEVTVTGTHRGELMGMPPTGRWTETYMASVWTFDEDGTLIEATVYWNPLAMLQQLGLAPGLDAATA
jgi:steroid delta-isomerase-like uncharacterized protein